MLGWWLVRDGLHRGRRVNLTSCEELVASIDPECSFDDKVSSCCHAQDSVELW